MDPQTLDTLIAAASALCIMLLLYGAWICLEHWTLEEPPPREAPRPAGSIDEHQTGPGFGDAKPK